MGAIRKSIYRVVMPIMGHIFQYAETLGGLKLSLEVEDSDEKFEVLGRGRSMYGLV